MKIYTLYEELRRLKTLKNSQAEECEKLDEEVEELWEKFLQAEDDDSCPIEEFNLIHDKYKQTLRKANEADIKYKGLEKAITSLKNLIEIYEEENIGE